ncbi:MAG TPA: complex I NDUFA9 subunit family protein [Vitreimonas sp.]|uniref:complex I NDUFA9 subunit family protein n=1 Tax=Vitreimonas sp. TaxID=3069702 RepID=UPI002D575AF2|nr:complex I NDUFA9 subunit family protein [Vitreimonas sp.]HYD87701.1 complex I NDUFA9 subunit family protein [Vitreimonas sp.]
MSDLVVVFGGSGFIGKQIVRSLAKRGYRVRIAMRRPHLGHELRVMGDVGQIQLVQANLRFPESVDAALEGAGSVINLVATLYESGPQNFEALHVEGARAVAEAAARRGVGRIVHISALGAGPKGSRFARSKYHGERAVLDAAPYATILRPSIVFGPEDGFFNRFGRMAATAAAFRPLGFLPLIGGGKTRFQPVFVGDVAEAAAAALTSEHARGRVFELGGPRIYSFRELMEYIREQTERRVPLVPLPFFVAQPMGLLFGGLFSLLPFNPPITGDQVRTLRRDNVAGLDPDAGVIADLGVTQLESVEAITPAYLWRFRPYGQFQTKQNPA